jgi:WhiB family redox-sensing transcriptional regulator
MPDLLLEIARLDGACAEQDPEIFFSEKRSTVNMAKRVCSGCDQLARCQELVLTHELETNGTQYGIYGGLTENERRNYRQKKRRPA